MENVLGNDYNSLILKNLVINDSFSDFDYTTFTTDFCAALLKFETR